MCHNPERSAPFEPGRSRTGGDVDTVPGVLWSGRPAHLSRWERWDAARIQLGLAVLTWALVAWVIRWSLSW